MLGEKIKEIREKEGLTQEEFAKEVFVSRTTVTKWETGKSLPSIDTLRLISEKYNVSSIPCLVLFDKGKEIKRNVGLISRDDLDNLIGG